MYILIFLKNTPNPFYGMLEGTISEHLFISHIVHPTEELVTKRLLKPK